MQHTNAIPLSTDELRALRQKLMAAKNFWLDSNVRIDTIGDDTGSRGLTFSPGIKIITAARNDRKGCVDGTG